VFGEVAVEGGGGLFGAAFPGGAGAGLFFGAGGFEAGEVEDDAGVAGGVEHEVQGEAVGFVEVEGCFSFQKGMASQDPGKTPFDFYFVNELI
jgi:hypothetical protein